MCRAQTVAAAGPFGWLGGRLDIYSVVRVLFAAFLCSLDVIVGQESQHLLGFLPGLIIPAITCAHIAPTLRNLEQSRL